MKKFLGTLLAVTLLFGLAGTALAADPVLQSGTTLTLNAVLETEKTEIVANPAPALAAGSAWTLKGDIKTDIPDSGIDVSTNLTNIKAVIKIDGADISLKEATTDTNKLVFTGISQTLTEDQVKKWDGTIYFKGLNEDLDYAADSMVAKVKISGAPVVAAIVVPELTLTIETDKLKKIKGPDGSKIAVTGTKATSEGDSPRDVTEIGVSEVTDEKIVVTLAEVAASETALGVKVKVTFPLDTPPAPTLTPDTGKFTVNKGDGDKMTAYPEKLTFTAKDAVSVVTSPVTGTNTTASVKAELADGTVTLTIENLDALKDKTGQKDEDIKITLKGRGTATKEYTLTVDVLDPAKGALFPDSEELTLEENEEKVLTIDGNHLDEYKAPAVAPASGPNTHSTVEAAIDGGKLKLTVKAKDAHAAPDTFTVTLDKKDASSIAPASLTFKLKLKVAKHVEVFSVKKGETSLVIPKEKVQKLNATLAGGDKWEITSPGADAANYEGDYLKITKAEVKADGSMALTFEAKKEGKQEGIVLFAGAKKTDPFTIEVKAAGGDTGGGSGGGAETPETDDTPEEPAAVEPAPVSPTLPAGETDAAAVAPEFEKGDAAAAAKDMGLADDELVKDAKGVVKPSEKLMEAAGVKSAEAFALPVLSAKTPEGKKLVAPGISLQGKDLLAAKAGDVKAVKLLGGDKWLQFSYVNDVKAFANGTFTVLSGGNFASVIDEKLVYTLVLFIEDDGNYDLNKDGGSVSDPVVIVKNLPEQKKPDTPEGGDKPSEGGDKPAPEHKDSGSSSGCDAGFAGLALLLAAPLFLRRRG